MPGRALRATLVALTLTTAAVSPARAQSSAEAGPVAAQSTSRLLDVPYVAQSEDLCGGAALAMVRRYWGDQTAVAEDFADLVDPIKGGIRTGQLTEAAGAEGWTALPFAGEAATGSLMTSQLSRGRPVVALLLERPGVFHYVVVTARTPGEVIFHDPARAPYRTLSVEEFDRRWSSSQHWMLLVVPAAASPDEARGSHLPSTASLPAGPVNDERSACSELVDDAVERAASGHLEEAATTLEHATSACPGEARAWRELAGVRFLQRRWLDAEDAADQSVTVDGSDGDAWRLLGATRFMQGDLHGALRALNQAGEPITNQVEVDGARLTPQPVVIGAMGLRPRQLLNADGFERAARRLADLPVAERTALRYTPTTDTDMTVQATLVERNTIPTSWSHWAIVGGRALGSQTVNVHVAGLARSGELWSASWRWNEYRPMVRFTLATPAPRPLPGVVTIDGSWERNSYAAIGRTGPLEQTRRRVGVGVTDWLSGSLRWRVGAALDEFDERPFLGLSGGVDRRWLDDRASVDISLDGWLGSKGSDTRFGRGTVSLAMRSSARAVPRVSARVGAALASSATPLMVWPTAGIGSDRVATLRAHPLSPGGMTSGPGLGRLLAFASVEHAQPLLQTVAGRAWWATFVDVAAAGHRGGGASASSTHVDIGTGLRLQVPGVDGVVNLDVAFGLRDHQVRVSAAVHHTWPGQ